MPGTDVVHGTICLLACYAKPGTDVAQCVRFRPMPSTTTANAEPYWSRIRYTTTLCARYDLSGTVGTEIDFTLVIAGLKIPYGKFFYTAGTPPIVIGARFTDDVSGLIVEFDSTTDRSQSCQLRNQMHAIVSTVHREGAGIVVASTPRNQMQENAFLTSSCTLSPFASLSQIRCVHVFKRSRSMTDAVSHLLLLRGARGIPSTEMVLQRVSEIFVDPDFTMGTIPASN
eukprot:3940833-Rhodomonas_salina.3